MDTTRVIGSPLQFSRRNEPKAEVHDAIHQYYILRPTGTIMVKPLYYATTSPFQPDKHANISGNVHKTPNYPRTCTKHGTCNVLLRNGSKRKSACCSADPTWTFSNSPLATRPRWSFPVNNTAPMAVMTDIKALMVESYVVFQTIS